MISNIYKTLFVTAWMLLLNASTVVFAQNGFGDKVVIFSAANNMSDFDLADIDGDGLVDLIVRDNDLAWVKNNGDGTFGSRIKINNAQDNRSYSFVSARDMTGNGAYDVIAASPAEKRVVYYINNGDGTFQNEEVEVNNPSDMSGFMSNMLTGDINSTGDIDVVYTVFGDGTLGFLENDGSGNFGDEEKIIGNEGTNGSDDLMIVDLDFDGNPDMVSSSNFHNKLAVYMNQGQPGNASFPSENVIESGKDFTLVHAADFYGDQFPELIYGAVNEIGFYPNQQTGNYVPGSQFIITQSAGFAGEIIVGDLTGSGRNDLVYTSLNRNEIIWTRNEGGFNNPFEFDWTITNTAFAVRKVMLQDMNDDGRPDIVATMRNGQGSFPNQVVWFENMTETAVSTEIEDRPAAFELEQNYPNPFNPTTRINFQLPQAEDVTLKVYDMLGREVSALLTNTRLSAGTHSMSFDGSGLSSGMYIYQIQAESFSASKMMTLIK